MTNASKILRTGAWGALLLASSALTAPALAQLPRFNQVDANGVDLVTGEFFFSLTEGSIGLGEGELSLVRNWAGSAGWTDNWSGILYSGTIGDELHMFVQFGTYSDTFSMTTSLPIVFTATKGNGATLEFFSDSSGVGYRYTAGDGTRIDFLVLTPGYSAGFEGPACAPLADGCGLPVSIRRPNGMTYTLNWDIEHRVEESGWTAYPRFRGVTNSANYSFTVNYATNTPGSGPPVSNWYVETGAQFTNLDGAPPSLPTVTYSPVSSTVLDVTDIGGRTWRLTTAANAIGIRGPGSSADDISATLASGLVTQVVRDGVTTGYSRSVSSGTITTTVTQIDGDSGTSDPQTVVVADEALGQITSVTDPLNRQSQFQYDGNSRLTRQIQPEGNSVGYTYDARGNVTEIRAREKDDNNDTGDDLVTSASYDSTCSNVVTCNQPNSTTDARGNVTNYTYDTTHGGVLTVTAPAPSSGATRPQTRYSYTQTSGLYQLTAVSACASGSTASPSCVGTSNETRTVFAYDSNRNTTSVERRSGNSSGGGALSATTAMTYDANGNLLTVDGPLSGTADTTRYRYNTARQVIGVIGPDPDAGGGLKHRALRATYDSGGRGTSVERGTVNSQSDGDWASFASLEAGTVEYDSHRRPFVRRLVSGGTTYALTQTSYDSLGRAECTAQRMNPSEFATNSLPSNACTLDTEGSHGPDRIARASFDAAGQLTRVQTGYGVTGLVADEATATYTSNGRRATVTDAGDNRTTYEYDGFDRLVKTRFPSPTTDNSSSTTDYEQLTLDAAGNVTSRPLRDGTSIGYTYDALNRLTAKDLPSSPWYNLDRYYAYDNFGRLTGANGNSEFTFAYDALGRRTGETSPWGTTAYQYDLADRRTRLTWPGSGPYVDYDHLVTGEITAIRENGATSGAGVLGTYVYDDRGRRASLTRGNGAVTSYSYDNVSRLSQLVQNPASTGYDLTLDFTHNPVGQIVSNTRSNDAFAWTGHYAVNRNYTANGLNQYSAAGSVTPSYDANGNLTAAGGPTYAYTSENVLVSASGASYQEMMADSLERLFRYYDGSANRWLVYDGQSLIVEYGGGGTVLRRYVHGPGVDEPLVWYEGSGTSDRRWLHADERGSVIAISNGSGTVTNVNSYDEYGIPGASNAGRFQYTGQQWLAEFGLQYSRARVYSPTLGRFMQTDPIGYAGGMNLHAYVLNDPINFLDPSGLRRWCVQDADSAEPDCYEFRPGVGAGILGLGSNWSSPGPSTPEGPMAAGNPTTTPPRPACPSPPADRTYPVPPGLQPSPLYPNHTFVIDGSGAMVMNPRYHDARVAAGAPSGPAGVGDLLGPNPGAVLVDLAMIASASFAAVYYAPVAVGQAIARIVPLAGVTNQSVKNTPRC